MIDVRTSKSIMCAACEKDSTGTFHFYAFYPSTVFEKSNNCNAVANVVIVIDRSGSMEGTPLEQAKRAAKACLSALDKDDRFTVIAFDDSIEIFSERLVEANKNNIFNAFTFIESIYARGGTELGMAIRKAQDVLISSKIEEGNIFIITDGQVYATEDIIRIAKRKKIRHHCLGIGSASQDRFINLLASETGGNSVFLTPRERIEEEGLKLFNSIKMHLGKIANYKFNGCQKIKIEPDFSRFILSGRPIVIFGETSELPNGELKINISQNGRLIAKTLPFKPVLDTKESFIKLLRGARIIDSIESQIGSFEDKTPKASKLLKKLTNASKKYGLASRTMGLVAVIKRTNDKHLNLPTTRVVPVGMPEDVEWGAYFNGICEIKYSILACPSSPDRFYHMRPEIIKDIVEESKTMQDLFELVSQIEPDGGVPGIDEEDRIKKTILALFRILDDKSNINKGVFKLHIRKMVRFLKQYEHKYPLISRIIYIAETHMPVPAGWEEIETGDLFWKQLETILAI